MGPQWRLPGHLTYKLSSENGKRHMVLMVNVDPSALLAGTLRQFNDLLYKAYCSTS